MLVRDLAMQIFRQLSGGNPTDEAGLSMLDYISETQEACATLITKKFWDNYKLTGESYLDENYITIYTNNPVLLNTTLDRFYIKTPADVLSLPKGMGISYVGLNENLQEPFARMSYGTASFFVDTPNDITSYIVTLNTIEFIQFDPAIKNVVVALLPASPTEINADDAAEIKEQVIRRILMTRGIPLDKINNSNPNDSIPQNQLRQRQEQQ